MKERPILFNAPMVRALLAGTKTQTRRAAKLPVVGAEGSVSEVVPSLLPNRGDLWDFRRMLDNPMAVRCPYGQPGDRLWVCETFGHFERNENFAPGCEVFYRADGESLAVEPWRPSIHMPRWASRISLGITSVRVERLQDISRGDAMAEGCPFPNMAQGPDPRDWYAELWGAINGPDSWAENPWAWVIEFKAIEAKP